MSMTDPELTLEALADLPESAYILYDVRDDVSFSYGTIPGALPLPNAEAAADAGSLPKDKKLVLRLRLTEQRLASWPLC